MLITYKLSYTSGSLLLTESEIIIDAYFETGSWKDARALVFSEIDFKAEWNQAQKEFYQKL